VLGLDVQRVGGFDGMTGGGVVVVVVEVVE